MIITGKAKLIKIIPEISLLLIFSGCGPKMVQPHAEEIILPEISFSADSQAVTIFTNLRGDGLDSLLEIVNRPLPGHLILNWFNPVKEDSLDKVLMSALDSHFNPLFKPFTLENMESTARGIIFNFKVDTIALKTEFERIESIFFLSGFIEPLFQRNSILPALISPAAPILLYPCLGIGLPHKSSRLPNALRNYRHGIHRGIDFFASWGTPVRSAAQGVVIRSDLNFKEISPDFRNFTLKQTKLLKRTPSDIFNSILLGRAVIIDHGFDLFKGYRSISIYAHLSHIESHIVPGYKIKAGEIFARTGNSGTNDSVLGTRNNSHLHWELILHDSEGEYYLGQGLTPQELPDFLLSLFKNE